MLVVYDPDRRYRELCLELATERISWSSTPARAASRAARRPWRRCWSWGRAQGARWSCAVYVPAKPPLTDEEKQRDPFALYAACGAVFPDGDGDEYLSLCLKAKPDHATAIRRIFAENPNPDFAVIDAVGGGGLAAAPGGAARRVGPRDPLRPAGAIDSRTAALKGQDAWVAEAQDLFQRHAGPEAC